MLLKFIYSEKATKFCKIFTLLLSYVVSVKRKVKISQNFVAFSEYMNFNTLLNHKNDLESIYIDISTRNRLHTIDNFLHIFLAESKSHLKYFYS